MVTRRDFLKMAGAAASLAVFGYTNIDLLPDLFRTRGEVVPPDALETEVETKYTVCLQCHGGCGIRCKIKDGRLIKIDGNPYHPNTLEPHIPYATDPVDALSYVGRTCAKGQEGITTLYNPYRVKQPLKRSGPRGSGQWETINWQQAVDEIVNGGTLPGAKAGEDSYQFEGLSAIRKYVSKSDVEAALGMSIKDFIQLSDAEKDTIVNALPASIKDNLIDPYQPELGPKSNQLVHMVGRAEHGRKEFTDRFFGNAFGTINMRNDHTDICELSHHVGYSLVSGKSHMKPDILNCEFLILFGASYLEASFPFQAVARKMAKATTEGRLKYVVVDPRASHTTAHAVKWVPIIPGADGALAMGMIKWILDNGKYDGTYLENTTSSAAADDNETTYTNATHLVQIEGAKIGKFAKVGNKYQVVEKGTINVVDFDSVDHGELDPGEVTVAGVRCKTAFRLLKDSTNEWTMEQYASEAGLDTNTIVELAAEFTSYGKKAVAEFYRGPVQHTNGLYNALAIITLNVLIGNPDWKGGLVAGGGHWHEMGKHTGNQYYPDVELQNKLYLAKLSPWGVRVSRGGSKYEESTEYVKNGYPARRPWFPLLGKNMCHACLEGIADGYPYPIKAVFITMANFNYSVPGMRRIIEEAFTDTSKVPLFVAFDVVISEFSSYADYILPEGTYLEQWGTPHVAPSILTKVSGVRQPAVPLLYPDIKLEEDWLIEIAKAMGLSGFGDNGFDVGVPLNQASDWYLKALANIASEGVGVPGLTAQDKMDYVLARGGRFEDYENSYEENKVKHRHGKIFNLYSEKLGTTIDSMTGNRFPGTAKYIRVADALGNEIQNLDADYPFHLITHKTAIHTQSRTVANPFLMEIWPSNWIAINPTDAAILGIADGDTVKITSATNTTGITGQAKLREGIRPGVIAISHNYGHWQYGAASNTINGKATGYDPSRAAGVQPSPLMRLDPLGKVCLTDKVGGSASFYDTKVNVAKA